MIKYINGDLFDTDCDIIMHGVNCKGGFGSGVAATVRNLYPKARHYYLDKFDTEGWKLGEVQFVPQWNNKVIANCATQDNYLPRGECHVDYVAVSACMEKVLAFAKENSYTIAMPKIGAGLAGGDWTIIEKVINSTIGDTEVKVYVL